MNPFIGQCLLGKTLSKAEHVKRYEGTTDEILFTLSTGEQYRFHHDQDCCEQVCIEDICGDLQDLVGSPLLQAEEVTSNENPSDIVKTCQDSFTWTFYRFATAKGFVVIRWYGESNGYYSESVTFSKVRD